MTRLWCTAACALVCLFPGFAPPHDAVVGLDHVPIAVADLNRSAADYHALGFSLKPGRPHDDGIQNQHVKFPDGTELELITAPDARDALTSTYREHLAGGDGPAFLALFARSQDLVVRALDSIHERYTRTGGFVDMAADGMLRYVFFGGRNASPTDRPEHFAHANTAESLVSVWLAADDLLRERRMLEAVGARVRDEEVAVPAVVRAPVAHFQEGTVVLLPGSRQIVSGRRIVGASVRVRDLTVARHVLERAVGAATLRAGRDGSVIVPPDAAHGLWLEFRRDRR